MKTGGKVGRHRKKGLEYFSLDVDFFSDKKIKMLKARYGRDGIAIYLYLLCEIYKENGYYLKWDKDYKYILADELNLTDGLIEQVLTFLVERSLFDDKLFCSDTILTSPGIQKRFQKAVKERAKKIPLEIERFWILNEKETEPYIKVTQNQVYSRKNEDNSRKNKNTSEEKSIKKSKVKESKEKNKKEIETFFESVWQLYPNKKGKTQVSLKNKKELYDLGYETIKLAIKRYEEEYKKDEAWKEMLYGSTFFNGRYKDYLDGNYELVVGKKKKKQKEGSFNNFPQRDYDEAFYTDLERRLL